MYEQYLQEWQPVEENYVSPWGSDGSGHRMVEAGYPLASVKIYSWCSMVKNRYMPFITDMLAFSPRIIPDNFVRAWV